MSKRNNNRSLRRVEILLHWLISVIYDKFCMVSEKTMDKIFFYEIFRNQTLSNSIVAFDYFLNILVLSHKVLVKKWILSPPLSKEREGGGWSIFLTKFLLVVLTNHADHISAQSFWASMVIREGWDIGLLVQISFILTFLYSLTTLNPFFNLIGWFIKY